MKDTNYENRRTAGRREGEPQIYTAVDLAVRWQCSLDVIYDLLRQRKLPGFKVGSSWRIKAEAVDNYERGEAV